MPDASRITFKDTDCVKLSAAQYEAVICPSLGCQVLRFTHQDPDCEIFRYREDVTIEEIKEAPAIWGLPTMYLPNRFDGGLIKTSDSEYHMPINETDFGNYLHGFVYKRPYTVTKLGTDGEKAFLTAEFVYGEDDEMYKYFGVSFVMTISFILDKNGLSQNIKLKNLCDKSLPVSIATHTCINAPLVVGGDEKDMLLKIGIDKKCGLNDRFLPDEKLYDLTSWDEEYRDGTKLPTGQVIENDMYTGADNSFEDKPFYGSAVYDTEKRVALINEVSREFKFFNIWNHDGDKGYFCPEPMTAMINSPNLKLPREESGYRELNPGEEFSCSQSFKIVKY